MRIESKHQNKLSGVLLTFLFAAIGFASYADSIPSGFSNPLVWRLGAEVAPAWVPGTNAVLKQFAAAHSNNVVLVDWDGTISQHADELAGDGIHPGMSNTIYAQAVKDSIAAWIKQGH